MWVERCREAIDDDATPLALRRRLNQPRETLCRIASISALATLALLLIESRIVHSNGQLQGEEPRSPAILDLPPRASQPAGPKSFCFGCPLKSGSRGYPKGASDLIDFPGRFRAIYRD